MLTYNGTQLFLWNAYAKYPKKNQLKTGGIPVPKYYYKIIYDKEEHECVAFLGLNDPHSEDLKETDLLCSNVCEKLNWLDAEMAAKWELEDKGHITCCTCEDLAKVVKNVTNFKSQGENKISDAGLLKN